jgi:hypothetical protein
MFDASVGYPPGLTRKRLISFARNTVNRGFSFVKILFTDPVNSETTIYRERENRTDLV